MLYREATGDSETQRENLFILFYFFERPALSSTQLKPTSSIRNPQRKKRNMEKDLRDAYKALTLLRADLTRTKKEKHMLRDKLTALENQQQDQQHAMTTASQERARMREEDFRAQLQRLQAKYTVVVRENGELKRSKQKHASSQRGDHAMKKQESEGGESRSNQHDEEVEHEQDPLEESGVTRIHPTPRDFAYSNAKLTQSNQDHESERTADTEQPGSNNEDDDDEEDEAEEEACQKKKKKKEEQRGPHEEPQEETSVVEEMVREKLGLLTNLFTLKSKIEEQALAILAQQASFAQERDELCMQIEEMGVRIGQLQTYAEDVEHEKQFMEEKYDFLVTELDLIKQERQEMTQQKAELDTQNHELQQQIEHQQRVSSSSHTFDLPVIYQSGSDGADSVSTPQSRSEEDGHDSDLDVPAAIRSRLREIESIREQLESERAILRQEKEEHEHQLKQRLSDEKGEAVDAAHARKVESLMQTNAILQQQLSEKEEQLATAKALSSSKQSAWSEEKYAELQRECDSLRRAVEESKRCEAERRDDVSEERENLVAELQRQREDLQVSVEKTTKSMRELEEANAKHAAAYALVAEKLRVVESEREALFAAKESLERDVESMILDREAVSVQHEKGLDALSHTIDTLQQQLQEKEEGIERLKVDFETTKQDEVDSQVSLCRQKFEDSMRERDAECTALQAQLQEMQQRESDVSQRHSEALRMAQVDSENHANELKRSLQDQQEMYAALVERNEQQETTNQHLERELETSRERIVEQEDSLQLVQTEQTLLQERVSELQRVLESKDRSILQLESEKQELVGTVRDAQEKLEYELEAQKRVYDDEWETKEEEARADFAEKVDAHRAQHEKLLKASAMEKKALSQEVRQLKQSLKQKDEELLQATTTLDATRSAVLAMKEEHASANQQTAEAHGLMQHQLSVLETQLMEMEDKKRVEEDEYDDFAVIDESDQNSRAWSFIERKVHELDHFLPQLQSFAFYLDSALCLCASNSRALDVLSLQTSRHTFTQEIVSFLRFASQLRRGVSSTSHIKHARRVHRQVLDLLSSWYECSDHDDIPSPPFGISSRESALVLHNWTSDKTKRLAAKRWLERMEVVTPSALEENDSLWSEGSTLELSRMTMEVKHAFLMLIVPILKRNNAIYVRVFTRKAMVSSSSSNGSTTTHAAEEEDTSWEMKIHVQLADALVRRRSSLGSFSQRSSGSSGSSSATSSRQASPHVRPRPPPLTLTASSTNHETLAAGISTPTSARKLQIIQEQLQRMQQAK